MVKNSETAVTVNCGNGRTVVVFVAPNSLAIAVHMSLGHNSHVHFNSARDVDHTSAVSVGTGCDSQIILIAHRIGFAEIVKNAVCLSRLIPAVVNNTVIGHRKNIIVETVIKLNHIRNTEIAVGRNRMGVEICFVVIPLIPVNAVIRIDYRVVGFSYRIGGHERGERCE